MTPGINAAKKSKISYHVHEYSHDAASGSYGDEAAQKLGISSERVFKTLVVSIDNKALVVAIIPVSAMLSMKLIAKAHGGKKATMALKTDVERSTGYVLGGVSPLGQKKRLNTFIDSSSVQFTTVFVSAGKRGLEIELSPQDLKQLTQAKLTELCQ
ncbi:MULTISPECIES: Cys-tRNA(Pro) deacylase [Colwellia]|uniref:Cys-tRNA(Pro)/Cys-tRNA(Cys) deacylase n=1 Tax=Colwellia psychrerythraea (strain 34H / ATCC BAA-681) TaxID=167879 RepID=Q47ZI2_COLP3|nr:MULTISPECIES: Cys-tRNA(Pro) deacylase [Colwellia]AAZ26708.1 ybaK/ebsC protein [Colwellia psychrerythraea 34H]PKH87200.1 Cys-tRNA(Pro) deacylase [Colwellia sp. Bg11-28]